MRATGVSILLALSLLLTACNRDTGELQATGETAPVPSTLPGTLTEEEMAVDAPASSPQMAEDAETPPLSADEADSLQIEILSETGYVNEKNQYVIDLLERDYAYLAIQVQTPEGRPVKGVEPHFEMKGSSRLSLLTEVSASAQTDDSGIVEFGVSGGKMGVDQLTVSVPGAEATLLLNIISLNSLGVPSVDNVEGALRWDDLMRARVSYGAEALEASFPPAVSAHNGKTVKIAGFMMPLDPDTQQHHFLITSNPPSCFFHIPGGPAGAVEVFSDAGIEATWDPIVIEGTFEALSRSEAGVVYRLSAARIAKE